jgi:prophage antirepressor-like protein
MTTDLEVFSNGDYNVRTLTDENGDLWFVASDIAKNLGYRDATNMLSGMSLEEDELRTEIVSTNAGDRSVQAISEPGLYNVLNSSRRPEAKLFKRWVNHEVLPSIRKTGQYAIEQSVTPAPVTAGKPVELQLSQYQKRAERREDKELLARGLYKNRTTGEILPLPGVQVQFVREVQYVGDTWAVNNPVPPAERRVSPNSLYRNTAEQDSENPFA